MFGHVLLGVSGLAAFKRFDDAGRFQGRALCGLRLVVSHCLCALRPSVPVGAGVCLIMADIEARKPSENLGQTPILFSILRLASACT